ncbi:hypothetical protein EDC94DRAFT_593307 [Helicostylum pulchrum]|nr:hypothetical protein EDC94DRAFT_593307 [Helicostylum pulchrum]
MTVFKKVEGLKVDALYAPPDCNTVHILGSFFKDMCITYNNRKCHVQMSGCSMKGARNERLKMQMIECSVVKPIHVVKKETDCFALLHFETEVDASTFYHIYCIQKKGCVSEIRRCNSQSKSDRKSARYLPHLLEFLSGATKNCFLDKNSVPLPSK